MIAALDEVSTVAHSRYTAFTDRLHGMYSAALLDSRFGTPALVNEVETNAEALASLYLNEEFSHVEDELYKIAQIAHTATIAEIASIASKDLTDAADEHVNASIDYLASEISSQVVRDVATLKRTLQRAALEVAVASRSRGISARSAVMEFVIGNKAGLQFTFSDRASRKWKSTAFVRSIWRQTMLSVYNEVVLFDLADHGLRSAMIHSSSPGAAHDGMIVSLSSNTDHPTYSEIRDAIFHPNSNAYLKMPEASSVPA